MPAPFRIFSATIFAPRSASFVGATRSPPIFGLPGHPLSGANAASYSRLMAAGGGTWIRVLAASLLVLIVGAVVYAFADRKAIAIAMHPTASAACSSSSRPVKPPEQNAPREPAKTLDERLREIETRLNDGRAPPTPEETAAEIERLRREPRDASWAPDAEKSLKADLHELEPKANFVLDKVSCGNTACIADITWNAGADPYAYGDTIQTYHYGIKCFPAIFLAEQIVEDARRRAIVLFDCKLTGAR